jgi:hypothetical protein
MHSTIRGGRLLAAVAGLAWLAGTSLAAAAPATMNIAVLEQRATRLADIDDIKRLQATYGYYIDRSQWDSILELLTDDVTLEYGSSGVYIGKAQARALFYGIGYGQLGLLKGQLRDHTQLQPVITLAPDGLTAKGRWHALVLLGQWQQYARWQTGPYENEYRKEGSVWKIAKLHWYETFTVPFAGGWKGRMPQSNVADRRLPPPDRPPSFAYDVWPAVSVPPYHFGNPAAAPAPSPAAPMAVAAADRASPARLTALTRAVQRLEDERDVQILQRTYGYYVDKNLWSEVASLFTADGTLEIGGRGVFVGRPRVLQYLQYLGKPESGRLYDHTQMQPVVHVAPDGLSAKGRWRALIFVAEAGNNGMLGDAIYENEYRKEDGRWRISKLHAWFILYADFEQGWQSAAMPNTRPEKDLPPDRPPSVVYDMYPGELTAPYHYPGYTAQSAAAAASTATVRRPATVAALAQRLARLEDAQAIENLQNAYGFYVGKRQWDEAARLFSRDGRFETGLRGVYLGPARIRRALELDGPQGLQRGDFNDHIQYQQVTHVAPDGRTARARVRELALTGRFEQEARVGGGTQENEYVKEDGVWKIRSLHQYTRFLADYDRGWGKGALPAPGPSAELPPDRPPTVRYAAFPTYFVPPLSYPNPVTGRSVP